jgi:FG-GAP-like repeat
MRFPDSPVTYALLCQLVLSGCGDTGGKATGPGKTEPVEGTPTQPPPPSCQAAPAAKSVQVQVPVLRATLPGSWDENWLASPGLVDINSDGNLDIVAPRHSVLYVYEGNGNLLFQTAFASNASNSEEHGEVRMWPSAVTGDLDGDGQVEIAVSAAPDSDGNNVALYDHLGELRPGWPRKFGSNEIRSITAADVNGDGNLEIVVNKQADGPATNVFRLDGSTLSGFPLVGECKAPKGDCIDYGGFNQNIGVGDLDGDKIMDIVSTYDAIGLGFFHGDGSNFLTAEGFTDSWVTGVEAYHDIALAKQGWGKGDRSEFTYSPPIIADINADGKTEVVVVGDHESSESTTNQGVSAWVLNPDMTRPTGWETPKDSQPALVYGDIGNNIVPTYPAPSVGNLDDNPDLEIIFPAYDGLLHAYRSNGESLWTYGFGQSKPYVGGSEALIADLNGDGSPEILFTTFTSGAPREPETPAHLVVLDAGGNLLHRVELFGRGSMAAPSIADLDGDGQPELVISLKDTLGACQGGVQIWELPGAFTNCLLWPTGRGNALRQGYVSVD